MSEIGIRKDFLEGSFSENLYKKLYESEMNIGTYGKTSFPNIDITPIGIRKKYAHYYGRIVLFNKYGIL